MHLTIQMSYRLKISLTFILICLIVGIGLFYQYQYNQRKILYREIITGYYRKHLGREPDALGLEHWVQRALNQWGLKRVERVGFIEAKEKGFH